jgi:hypothetical protein
MSYAGSMRRQAFMLDNSHRDGSLKNKDALIAENHKDNALAELYCCQWLQQRQHEG